MSEREEPMSLDALPNPPSPAALDDKILAYARQRAGQRQPLWRSGFAGGVVTACVLFVAVYITDLSQPIPTLDSAVPQPQARLDTYTPISGEREEKEIAAVEATKSVSRSTLSTPPAAQAKRKLKASPKPELASAGAVPAREPSAILSEAFTLGESLEETLPVKPSYPRAITYDMKDQEADEVAIDAPQAAAPPAIPAHAPAAAAAATTAAGAAIAASQPELETRKQARLLEFTGAASDIDKSKADRASLQRESIEFLAQLQQCETLLEAGEIAKADALYEKLRERCRNCDLPQSLKEALEQQANTATQPEEKPNIPPQETTTAH